MGKLAYIVSQDQGSATGKCLHAKPTKIHTVGAGIHENLNLMLQPNILESSLFYIKQKAQDVYLVGHPAFASDKKGMSSRKCKRCFD